MNSWTGATYYLMHIMLATHAYPGRPEVATGLPLIGTGSHCHTPEYRSVEECDTSIEFISLT